MRRSVSRSAARSNRAMARRFIRHYREGGNLVGPGERASLASRHGPNLRVLVVALAALLFGAAGPAHISRADEPAAADRSAGVPFIYQNKRSFRIPFHIDAQGRAHLKEVQLWVSEDSGSRWEPRSRTAPDMGKFTFRTSHDGEFWFATRALTVDGKYSPPMNQTVEPSMKVVVDTVAPSIVLQSEGRRGSSATVRWDVKDECLDLKTLLLEYQVEGASDWRKVPIRRRSPRGSQTWDAGTADALRVRGSVADKAGNVADTEIVLPEGSGGEPDFTALDTDSVAPPVEQISSPGSSASPGAELPPVQESASPGPGRGPSSRSPARHTLARRSRAVDGETAGAFPAAPDWDRASTGAGGGSPGGTMRTINTPDPAVKHRWGGWFSQPVSRERWWRRAKLARTRREVAGDGVTFGQPGCRRRQCRFEREPDDARGQLALQASVRYRGPRTKRPLECGAVDHPRWRANLDQVR